MDNMAESSSNEGLRFSAVELFAGGVAGLAEHLLMFPFDTVKTRMQSGVDGGVRSVFRTVWREERLAHLYRGCVPVLVSAVPAHAAYFGVYEAVKRVAGDTNVAIGFSASCATAAHDTVSTPFDVVKQRMQMDHGRTYTSSYNCATRVIRAEGVQSLFVSLPTTILMNIPHFATYWIVYESALTYAKGGESRSHEEEMTLDFLCSGFLAGGLASVVSFPFDTVKTHLQLGRGKGFFPALQALLRTRGMKGIFAGVIPRVMYTAPAGAIMMVTYESTKNLFA